MKKMFLLLMKSVLKISNFLAMVRLNRMMIAGLLLSAPLIFQSCRKVVGEGPVVTEIRTTGNFSGIDMSISGELYYTQGADYKVEIKAQQNILNEIEAVVSGTTLKIKEKSHNVNLKPDDRIVVNITAPDVNSLSVSGSGNIHATTPIEPNILALNISGSGGINLSEVVSSSLNATVSGSGNIFIGAGTVAGQTLRVSGSGNIDVVGVSGQTATATISGSGNIKLFPSQSLHAKIAGSGNVYYKGTPAITSEVSGSGSIVHL